MTATLSYSLYDSPLGDIILVTDSEEAVCMLCFDPGEETRPALIRRHCGEAATRQAHPTRHTALHRDLDAYFSGELTSFDWPLALHGTPFRRRVWQALRAVPYGATCSYSTLATQAGHPRAIRAAASACATNPVSIAVPCHRVIHKDGSLSQYGGGIARKKALLERERAAVAASGSVCYRRAA